MASVSIGDAIGEGFGLIRRRPVSVLLWGLIQTAVSSSAIAVMAPVYRVLLSQMAAAGKTGGAPPDLGALSQLQGVSSLVNFGGLAVTIVLYCAVFRAVLNPEANRFAYLRLGPAEFFLFIVGVMASLAFGLGVFVLFVPIVIVTGIGLATHAIAISIILGVSGFVAAVGVLIYLTLRFSLVGPMTVQEGKFILFESWTLTRGKVGSLFLMALCTAAILLVSEIIVGAILLVIGAGVLGAAAGGLGNLSAYFKQPLPQILDGMAPILAGLAVVWVPFSGFALAIAGAPWARAYRDLAGPDLAATFS